MLKKRDKNVVDSSNKQKQPKDDGDADTPTIKRRALIVAPASVMQQWRSGTLARSLANDHPTHRADVELTKWGEHLADGGFRVGLFHGTRTERLATKRNLLSGKVDLLITSYEMFRRDFIDINQVPWDAVLFDEAHRLKDPRAKTSVCAKELVCRRRYGLTGTVIQNNLEELWNLVDWAQPDLLGSLERMRQEYASKHLLTHTRSTTDWRVLFDRFIDPIKFGQQRDATVSELAVGRHASLLLSRRVRAHWRTHALSFNHLYRLTQSPKPTCIRRFEQRFYDATRPSFDTCYRTRSTMSSSVPYRRCRTMRT